jgi:hypothetical protein
VPRPRPEGYVERPTTITCDVCSRPVEVAPTGRIPEACPRAVRGCYDVHDAVERLRRALGTWSLPSTRAGVAAGNALRGELFALANEVNGMARDAQGKRPKVRPGQLPLPLVRRPAQ